MVISHLIAQVLSQIYHQSHITSPSLFSLHSNNTGTFLHNQPDPMPSNPFGMIEHFQPQPVFQCSQKFCHSSLTVQRLLSNLFHMVVPLCNALMSYLQISSHPYFLPLVESAVVRLPQLFGKLLQGEFALPQVI